MSEKKKERITCVVCPIGCKMDVELNNGKVISVKGNQCKRGESFALKEVTNPERIITTTIKIDSKTMKRLPVRSREPVPKRVIMELIEEIKALKPVVPVRMGDIIGENILGENIDIISSTDVLE